MQQYGLPLVLRIKYQPSSYKCSCAHTTLYIVLLHTRPHGCTEVMGTGRKKSNAQQKRICIARYNAGWFGWRHEDHGLPMSSDEWRCSMQIRARYDLCALGIVREYLAGVFEIYEACVIDSGNIMKLDSIKFLPLKRKHKARYLD